MRRTRRFARQRGHMNDIPLTPLIDTALTLLIISMVTAPMIQNAIRVDLPRGAIKEDGGMQQEFVVYVDKDNQLFFNNTKMTLADVLSQLKGQVTDAQDTMIFVKADQLSSYGQVIELVDHMKQVEGVRYVALATQKGA